MKQKTGRKLLSLLLTLALVIGLLPGMSLTALAYDGNPYADLVTTGRETDDQLTAKQVTFNGKKWHIIKDDSQSATAGTLTLLLADNSLGQEKFDTNGRNDYSTSSLKAWLDDMI